MLETQDWSTLHGLYFTARRLVEGALSGGHEAAKLGFGGDFFDYRPYVAGDDVAHVDWKLFGRTDRLYVRRYRRMADLHLYVMLDTSGSMHFAGLGRRGRPVAGGNVVTKLEYGKQLAAVIAMLTVRQGDRVGLGVFADGLLDHLPAAGTMASLKRFCAAVERAPAPPGEGNVSKSLRQAYALQKRRGVLVLITDALDPAGPIVEELSRYRFARSRGGLGREHGWDVIVMQVLTRQELDLSPLADMRLTMVDAETRQSVPVDVGKVARRYRDLVAQHVASLRRQCAARGIGHHVVTTDKPVAVALRRIMKVGGR